MVETSRPGLTSAGVTCALLAVSACTFGGARDATQVSESLSAARAADRAVLALHWAPVHFQDVDPTGRHALGGAADYITRYDFDGDLEARNNWDNASHRAYPLTAHAYHSVTETESHWFILYMFFHPRDWADSFFAAEHENDSEGLLVVVQRDGSRYGSIRAAVTVAHNNFYSYVPESSPWAAGAESIDGVLPLVYYEGGLHPTTAQESRGHGLKAWPDNDIRGSDGLVYYPTLDEGESPTGPNDRAVRYHLVDIFGSGGLWYQRGNSALFARHGSFAGDKSGGCGAMTLQCTPNAANAPWGWDDRNDAPNVVRGQLATDPAVLAATYFTIPEPISGSYSFNPYNQDVL